MKRIERRESLIAFLSRAVRDSTLMTNLALNIRARTARRLKQGRLRWYVLAALFAAYGLGKPWILYKFVRSFRESAAVRIHSVSGDGAISG